MRPISSRTSSTIRMTPTMPDGPYPQDRECGHAGIAPSRIRMRMMIRMVVRVIIVPRLCCAGTTMREASGRFPPRRKSLERKSPPGFVSGMRKPLFGGFREDHVGLGRRHGRDRFGSLAAAPARKEPAEPVGALAFFANVV